MPDDGTDAVVDVCTGTVFHEYVYGGCPPVAVADTVPAELFAEQDASGAGSVATLIAAEVAEQPPLLTTTV